MSLDLERERTVQALCAHFAQDHLTTQELELRFEEVYRATSVEQLQVLAQGLPELHPAPMTSTPLPTYSVASATVPAAAAFSEKRFLALMADVRRDRKSTRLNSSH